MFIAGRRGEVGWLLHFDVHIGGGDSPDVRGTRVPLLWLQTSTFHPKKVKQCWLLGFELVVLVRVATELALVLLVDLVAEVIDRDYEIQHDHHPPQNYGNDGHLLESAVASEAPKIEHLHHDPECEVGNEREPHEETNDVKGPPFTMRGQ